MNKSLKENFNEREIEVLESILMDWQKSRKESDAQMQLQETLIANRNSSRIEFSKKILSSIKNENSL